MDKINTNLYLSRKNPDIVNFKMILLFPKSCTISYAKHLIYGPCPLYDDSKQSSNYFYLKAEYFISIDLDKLTTDLRVQYCSVLYSLFSGQTMANFGGHAIPGTFFMLYGFWLTVKHVLQHSWRTRQPKGRQIMPPFFKKMEYFEGGFQIFASFVGQYPSSPSLTPVPVGRFHDLFDVVWFQVLWLSSL